MPRLGKRVKRQRRSSIYLIGSLRNPKVPKLANYLREKGFDVFDDWYAAGPEADDYWRKYERQRGRNYDEALSGYAAEHVHGYDDFHITRCNIGVLYLPAGKSGHIELGIMRGQGKRVYILMEGMPPKRWDVMYRYARRVFFNKEDLRKFLDKSHR